MSNSVRVIVGAETVYTCLNETIHFQETFTDRHSEEDAIVIAKSFAFDLVCNSLGNTVIFFTRLSDIKTNQDVFNYLESKK